MPRTPVLIAALSARALAASAARAGYRPLVVDCFGDADLAAEPDDTRTLPAHVRAGFDSASLLQAVDELKRRCDTAPVGLVLGSGFEDRPGLMAKLSDMCPLLGTDAETTRALKDPNVFFPLLDKLKIAHPEFKFERPNPHHGWLRKRVGASGGLHIRPCSPTTKAGKNRYFQRHIQGDAISVLAVVSKTGTAFALSQQWLAPTSAMAYRYGGAVSHVALPLEHERELLDAARALTSAAGVRGLVSIDFIVNDDGVYCLEINPRPGATLDVHDDDAGTLFEAHIRACQNSDAISFLERHWSSDLAKASAYLYADHGPVKLDDVPWPDYVRDRPNSGIVSAKSQPVASVCAAAPTAEKAKQSCISRLAGLEEMLYDKQNGKEISA